MLFFKEQSSAPDDLRFYLCFHGQAQAEHINFLSDYLREIDGANMPDAIKAWNILKSKGVSKTFAGWKQLDR